MLGVLLARHRIYVCCLQILFYIFCIIARKFVHVLLPFWNFAQKEVEIRLSEQWRIVTVRSHPAALVTIKRACLNNPLLNRTWESDVWRTSLKSGLGVASEDGVWWWRGWWGCIEKNVVSLYSAYPLLPLPRLHCNLGVIPGKRAVYGFMPSDWRPPNKDIDKIGRPPI